MSIWSLEMIQSSSFNAAIPFAERLSAVGLTLSATQGTPLGELVRLSVPLERTDFATTTDLQTYGDAINTNTVGFNALENPTQHSLEIDSLINDISKAVNVHIGHARNVVRPLVSEFAESIQKYLTTNNVKDASEQFTVEVLRLSALLKDESFLDTLTYYKNKSILEPDISLNLDPKTKEELEALVLTGHDRTDKLIVEWLSHLPDYFLTSIWYSFFTKATMTEVGGRILFYGDLAKMNVFEKTDYALALFLISRKITVQVEDKEGQSLKAYQNICTQYTDYSGVMLVNTIERVALSIKTKSLVVECSSIVKLAKVNGEVYGPWLDAGGTPEIIMGLIVSGDNISSQEMVDKKADEYKRQWNSYCSYYKTAESNKSFDYFKLFLINEFMQSMRDKQDVEVDYIAANPGYNDTVAKKANEYILGLRTDDCKDANMIALCMVAGIRFHYTSSYQLLNDIREASEVNPNVDVREAAFLAVINYVADYLALQINVVK